MCVSVWRVENFFEAVFDYCDARDMLADALTTALPRPAFERCRTGMGMIDLETLCLST
jgi:hypothetical protein